MCLLPALSESLGVFPITSNWSSTSETGLIFAASASMITRQADCMWGPNRSYKYSDGLPSGGTYYEQGYNTRLCGGISINEDLLYKTAFLRHLVDSHRLNGHIMIEPDVRYNKITTD